MPPFTLVQLIMRFDSSKEHGKSYPIETIQIGATPTPWCRTNLKNVPALFFAISGVACIDICARSGTDVSQVALEIALTCYFEIVSLQMK